MSIIRTLFLATAEVCCFLSWFRKDKDSFSLKIQPHSSAYTKTQSPNTIPSPTSFSLSYKTRKFLALGLPAWYLSWSLAPFLPEVWSCLSSQLSISTHVLTGTKTWNRCHIVTRVGQINVWVLTTPTIAWIFWIWCVWFSTCRFYNGSPILSSYPIIISFHFLFSTIGLFPHNLIDFIAHVFWPILFLVWCAKTSRWSSCLAFVNCFGILSFSAVLTELFYPAAPPWYYEKYGFAPADYSLPVCSSPFSPFLSFFHFFSHEFSSHVSSVSLFPLPHEVTCN